MKKVLVIDIGGTRVKAQLFNFSGKAIGAKIAVPTPKPALYKNLLKTLMIIVSANPSDYISIGFPGIIKNNQIFSAPNMHKSCIKKSLAQDLKKITKAKIQTLNDADLQGCGVVKGKGLELALTLGTGLGSGVFVQGHLIRNFQICNVPYDEKKSLEDLVSKKTLERIGKGKWNQNLKKVLQEIDDNFRPDHLYITGGNAQLLKIKKRKDITILPAEVGLVGGVYLWHKHLST